MNWIIKPGLPTNDFVPYCITDKPSQCTYKDCSGAETYTCNRVDCNVLTCVAGGYTCIDASCVDYWGQCFQTDNNCPAYCPDYCPTHCPTKGWICTGKTCNPYTNPPPLP
ncbi:MAG: hypothetical protein ABFD23_06180 [Caldisericales bacterium]|nr:hypothetical protein [bacterium]